LQSNDVGIQNESFEIDAMIKEIYETNKYTKNLEITFDYIIDIDKKLNYVIGDVAKIKQILHNFVSNAFKYTQSGIIHLGVKFIDSKYYFYVKDTGIGIKEEIKEKIFENFFQTDDFYDGTGLGLSISKALSKIIKGEITVDSEIGVGTEFGLTLALDRDNSKTEMKNESHFGNKLALIAEDQKDNYLLLNTVLKKLKIDTKRAINGLEVVEMARDEKFDVIFMDIKMPFMNGIEALKQIREFNPNITIFAVTAYAFDSDREELLEAGFDEYISKPVNIDELRTKIKALI
jgi:CheY-like chemotaxis protein